MNLDCLIDYVGLDNCLVTTTPDSGRYINELEGMTTIKFDQIASEEDGGVAALWQKIQKSASRAFANDLQREFAMRYKLRGAIQFLKVPQKIDINSTTNIQPNYSGHTIELDWENCNYVNSNYQEIFIDSINFFASTVGNYTIKVFDLDNGIELYSTNGIITPSLSQKWNNKIVNKSFNAKRIFIGIDQTAIQLSDNSIASHGCLYNTHGGKARIIGGTVPLANINANTPISLNEGSNTYGVAAVFTVKCVFDNLVCLHKDYFLDAWMYQLAMTFMNYAFATTKINRWTTSDLPKQQTIMKLYRLKYEGGEDENGQIFQGFLYGAVNSLIIDCNDVCFFCNDTITFRTSLM